MKFFLKICLVVLTLSACVSTRDEAVYVSAPVASNKTIALVGTRFPWVSKIEQRLRKKGYSIKRFASVSEVTKETSENSSETFDKATARVILVLDGFAPNSSMTRCFGGGFKFNYINAELIDSLNNETLASYSNSGYSEGCPPLSGSIFEDITNMVFQSVN
jgi:hypothetical protein